MRKLIWLDSAVNDLVRLRKFIVRENITAAKLAADTIKNAANLLLETPFIGKPVKDLIEHRDLLARFGAGGYIIRYRIYLDTIYVIHVRHFREIDFK